MPATRQPRPAPGRDRRVPALPRGSTGVHRPRGRGHAEKLCDQAPAGHEGRDHEAARARVPVPRARRADPDVPSLGGASQRRHRARAGPRRLRACQAGAAPRDGGTGVVAERMTGRGRVVTRSPDETLAVAKAVGELLRPGDVVSLAGDLGTGKTVFARGVARALGVSDPVVSPSFTIVREYEGRVPVVHVDVYRIGTFQELHDLGFEEVVREDAVTLVEWGDAVDRMLPADRLEVRLAAGAGDDERVIEIEGCGRSWRARAAELAVGA